jgi:hypothetical protein
MLRKAFLAVHGSEFTCLIAPDTLMQAGFPCRRMHARGCFGARRATLDAALLVQVLTYLRPSIVRGTNVQLVRPRLSTACSQDAPHHCLPPPCALPLPFSFQVKEDADAASLAAVQRALEAAWTALIIMTTPGMPNQVRCANTPLPTFSASSRMSCPPLDAGRCFWKK